MMKYFTHRRSLYRSPVFFLLLVLTISAFACKGPYTIADAFRMKMDYTASRQPFILRGNQIMVPTIVDGLQDTVFFDTGFSGMVGKLSDVTEVTKRRNYYQQTEAPDQKVRIEYNKYSPSIKNNIWQFVKPIGIEIFTDKGWYNPIPSKIIGFPVITLNKKYDYFLLNFSDSTIGYADKDSLMLTDFMEVRCSFDEKGMYIFLTVNSSEEKFYFDSGFGYSLILNRMPGTTKMKPDPIEFEGAMFMSAFNPIVSDYHIYQNYPVQVYPKNGSIQLFTSMVYAPSMLQNTVGLDFMKRFDWVIDSKNKKVFLKPISTNIYSPKEIDIEGKKYGAAIIGENLQLIFRQKKNTVLPLFKNIISVNDTMVTRENIVEWANYLNNLNSWANVRLKFD